MNKLIELPEIRDVPDVCEPQHGLLPIEDAASATNAFFDTGRNLYWILNRRGGWIALNETQFKRILKQRNISPKVPTGSYVAPLDERLINSQQTSDLHYARAMAAYGAGLYHTGKRR